MNKRFDKIFKVLERFNIPLIKRQGASNSYDQYECSFNGNNAVLNGKDLDLNLNCKINDYFTPNDFLKSFLRISLKTREFSISYRDDNSFYFWASLTHNEPFIIHRVLNFEVYNFIEQVLLKECPIEIFYDWILEKYPEIF